MTEPTFTRPDPEVPAKPRKRFYTAEYKLRVLEMLDACKPGEQCAIVRREGLYSTTIGDWRRARIEGKLGTVKMGRPTKDPRDIENERLRKENAKLKEHVRRANLIIDVQKKIALLLDFKQPTEAEILTQQNPK